MPRQSRGLRQQVVFRMPIDLYARFVRAADKRGMTINDAMVFCVRAAIIELEGRDVPKR